MRIDNTPKLNFDDVLLKPKRSTLTSRKDVDMTRKFEFRNSKKVRIHTLPIHFGKKLIGCHGGTNNPEKDINHYIRIFKKNNFFSSLKFNTST